MAVQGNDAAGGAGSLVQSLLGIAVNGISRSVDGVLSKKYPLTSGNQQQAATADGLKPRGAPGAPTTAGDMIKGLLANPLVIGLGISAAITVALVLILRRK